MTQFLLGLIMGGSAGAITGWLLSARRYRQVVSDLRRQREWETEARLGDRTVTREALENRGTTRITKGRMRRRRMHITNRKV